MCAHTDSKTGYLTAEYIWGTFWLVPPPPIPQVHRGGCYREKFFLIFSQIPLSTRSDYTSILIFIFLIFARNLSEVWIEIFFLFFQSRLTRFKFLDISHEFRFFCLSNIINYRFDSHTSFARYYLDYDFWLRFWFSTRIFYFLDSFFLSSISTCFSIVDYTL